MTRCHKCPIVQECGKRLIEVTQIPDKGGPEIKTKECPLVFAVKVAQIVTRRPVEKAP